MIKKIKLEAKEEFASIHEVQAGTSKLLEGAAKRGTYIRVVKNSKPIGVLMPNVTFDRLTEDLLALSSPQYLHNIAMARAQKKEYSLEEVMRLRSFMIGLAGKDPEGAYRPEFVKRVLASLEEEPTHRFQDTTSFLEQLN